jgi:hypothetical protein
VKKRVKGKKENSTGLLGKKCMWVNRPKTKPYCTEITQKLILRMLFILSETGVYPVLKSFLARGKIWGKRKKKKRKGEKGKFMLKRLEKLKGANF